MKGIAGLFFCIAMLLLYSTIAEEKLDKGKIVHLDLTKLDSVELSAVEDYPFMKVIDGDNQAASKQLLPAGGLG